MKYRFYNARILTLNNDEELIDNGCVWVFGNIIKFVGTTEPQETIKWDREIDCHQNVLMPGFKNAHTHSAMTLFRSKADDMKLQDWLFNQVFPAEDKLTPDDIYELTRLAVMEYVSGGITSIFDMYLTPETIADACNDTGMRCMLVGGTCGTSNYEASIERMEKFYEKWNQTDGLIGYQLGMHAEYTCDYKMIEYISASAHKYKAPMFMHLSETKKETDECMERYNMTPTKLLDSCGIFDFGGGAYHCVHVNDEDIEIFKKRGVIPVTNPGSNCKLASGIAPITKFLEANVPVAIGTDGAGSNNCLDMFREMFLVTGLGKIKDRDAAAVPADAVLKMACCNGAHVMQLKNCDCLKAGNLADMIMIDMMQPNMQPVHNILKNIVYSGSKSNVCMTMINGKILYENGEYHIGVSREEVYQKSAKICGRIFNK